MWDDPTGPVVRHFKEEKQEDKAPPDPRLEFFSEYQGGRGHNAGRPERAHLPWNVCVTYEGRHACQPGRCPKRDQGPRPAPAEPIQWRRAT
jgi:hypothetical protein